MQQTQLDDLPFCPSFSCYSSNSLASTAANRISNQLQEQVVRLHDVVDEEEFEFSFVLKDKESSDLNLQPFSWRQDTVQEKLDEEVIDCSYSMEKLFITEPVDFDSSSSSDSDIESSVLCVSPFRKYKKSASSGSGSRPWRIRDLLRRSNSEGKEHTAVLVSRKKVEATKQKSSVEAVAVSGKLKPSVHELLYVQQREGGKRKCYLPYRKELVGFFNHVKMGPV